MVYFFIIYLFIILFVLSDVSVNILNEHNKTIIKFRFLYIISFSLSSKRLDMIVDSFKHIEVKEGLNDFKKTIKNRKLIFKALKKIDAKTIHIIYYEGMEDISLATSFLASEALHTFKYIARHYLKSVNDESYTVRVGIKRDIDFNIKLQINTFDLIIIGIKAYFKTHNNKKRKKVKA